MTESKSKDWKEAQLFIFSFLNFASHNTRHKQPGNPHSSPTSLYKPSYKILGEIAWSNNSIILMLFIFILLEESSFSSSNFSLNLLESVTSFSHEDPPNLLLIRHSLSYLNRNLHTSLHCRWKYYHQLWLLWQLKGVWWAWLDRRHRLQVRSRRRT